MSALLEALSHQESTATESAYEAYRSIVRQLAEGRCDPELKIVRCALAEVGKSTAELTSDVAKARHRNDLRKKVIAAREAESERSQVESQLETAKEELQRAQDKFNNMARPLRNRLSDIAQLASEGFLAANELTRDCDDPRIATRLSVLRSKLDTLHTKLKQQEGVVSRIRRALADEKATRRPARPTEWRKDGEGYGGDAKTIAAIQSRLDTAEKELADLRTQQAALLEDDKTVRAEMLES